MCRAVSCKTCGKTTWAGCGQHIDAVKKTVAPGLWCNGHARKSEPVGGRGGFLARLFGR